MRSRFIFLGLLVWSSCDAGTTQQLGSYRPLVGCDVPPTPPPASLGLDPFYAKYLDASGIPVLGSSKVADVALVQACRIVGEMVSKRDDVRQAMMANHVRAAVQAEDEVTTDIPEYEDLYSVFPGTDWDALRGLSATSTRPVASCGEENLRCLASDRRPGETMLVWTFAIGLQSLGISEVDPNFEARLQAAFTAATTAGLWPSDQTTTPEHYFALGTQIWFDANQLYEVDTRAKLQAHDPPLAAILADFLPEDSWHPTCP